jgi:hypothetical protein
LREGEHTAVGHAELGAAQHGADGGAAALAQQLAAHLRRRVSAGAVVLLLDSMGLWALVCCGMSVHCVL